MREQRNDPKRLKDILQAIDTIFQYVDNREMKEFLSDKKSYHAVIYNITKVSHPQKVPIK
jgi:uncharacterized protein with HEPN domain